MSGDEQTNPDYYIDPNTSFHLIVLGDNDEVGDPITEMACYFCHRGQNKAVYLGDDPDGFWLIICDNCLKHGLGILEGKA